ncbi:hypothetical protein ACG33_09895 [Steroidobacter denitrificans]|uniref:Uncharacterized protein n=1 Tax=Steroidobacter denitrificans TaxID=465721 RepID=A0A127FAF9_STEDE|nr:hypothetical protein ACG33_09895 [Steroidobacter denitrificans]
MRPVHGDLPTTGNRGYAPLGTRNDTAPLFQCPRLRVSSLSRAAYRIAQETWMSIFETDPVSECIDTIDEFITTTLATRNSADFTAVANSIVDPWKSSDDADTDRSGNST